MMKRPRQHNEKHGANLVTHGLTRGGKPPEYNSWCSMIARCYNPNHVGYSDYGGRGITVCDEWRGSYAAFVGHVGTKPSPRFTIDRIDNNRGYEPGNVRWASRAQQNSNRRSVRPVYDNGRYITLKEYCRRHGLNYQTVYSRITKRGWSLERALEETVRRPRQRAEAFLAFIRGLPCIACGDDTSTEAAHIRMSFLPIAKPITGMGIKPDDNGYVVPLCSKCHRQQHKVGEQDFWPDKALLFVRALAIFKAWYDDQPQVGEQIVRAAHD